MENPFSDIFTVYQWDITQKVRLGDKFDGGYIVAELETKDESPLYDCYISAGVEKHDEISHAIIEKFGLNGSQCFAFDGTVDSYPVDPPTDIQFTKKNIGSENNDQETNLFDLIGEYNNIFLKMDIEGGEYPWLRALSVEQLQRFRQIIIEVHGCNDDSWGTTWSDKLECLKKLSTTHFLVHAHGNNFSGIKVYLDMDSNGQCHNMTIPDVLELTYIRKFEIGALPLNTTVLPISGLDVPNGHYEEIDINCMPFVHPK
jgi:Methyltransferase FkbM domain